MGLHTFSKPLLKAYQDVVIDPALGQELARIVSGLGDKGYNMGTKTYKRVPRDYDLDHQYKELLLFS